MDNTTETAVQEGPQPQAVPIIEEEQQAPQAQAVPATEGGESTTTTSGVVIDRDKVQQVLNMLRPYLQADGGDCELVAITTEGVVQLRLQGACGTCPSSTYTLKMGIEEQLKQYVPGVTEVIAVP